MEKSFPRGGNTQIKATTRTTTPSNILSKDKGRLKVEFGANISRKYKNDKLNRKQRQNKQIKKNEEKLNDTAGQNVIKSISQLTFKTIMPEMLLMGLIIGIDATFLLIVLPGGLIGKILISSISKSYLNLVNKCVYNNDEDQLQQDTSSSMLQIPEIFAEYKTLSEIYKIGQIVCVKLIEKHENTDGAHNNILLSMCPNDINSQFQHNLLKKNMILCVAIESIEDHGYIIEIGIKNLRGFLPKYNAINKSVSDEYSDTKLHIGEVIFCKIDNIKITSTTSTVIVKQLPFDKRECLSSINLNYLLPTIIVKFKIVKILKDGLQGIILFNNDRTMNEDDDYQNKFIGLINEYQLEKPFSKSTDYKINQILTARILYCMPITKYIYLSLNLNNNFLNNDSEILTDGTIIETAKVIRVANGGIILKLTDNAKGLIKFKQLYSQFKNLNFDKDELLLKYYIGSSHRVRTTCYNPLDSLYVCTVDERILNEKFYQLDDVQVGDFVQAKLEKKMNDGSYFIRIGKIKGYLQYLYISKIPSSIIKLKENATIKVRIIKKNDRYLYATNHKEFMNTLYKLPQNYENLKLNNKYYGLIIEEFKKSYLIQLSNDLCGLLIKSINTKEQLNIGDIQLFRITSLINIKTKSKQIILSLNADDNFMDAAKIPNNQNSLAIKTNEKQEVIVVKEVPEEPLKDLSEVKVDDKKIQNNQNSLSIKTNKKAEAINFKAISEEKLQDFSEIKVGDIINGNIKNMNDDIIEVTCNLTNCKGNDCVDDINNRYTNNILVKIHRKMFFEQYSTFDVKFTPKQQCFLKILGINHQAKKLCCSGKLSDVWHGDLEITANILNKYFNNIESQQISSSLSSMSSLPHFCKYKIGDFVNDIKIMNWNAETNSIDVKINKTLNGCITYGSHSFNKCPKNMDLKLNDLVGIIIWIDYNKNLIYLNIRKTILQRYFQSSFIVDDKKKQEYEYENKLQLLKCANGLKCDVLLIHDDFILTLPRKIIKNRFLFIPKRLHYNDFQQGILINNGIFERDICNVNVLKTDGIYFIGIFTNIYKKITELEKTNIGKIFNEGDKEIKSENKLKRIHKFSNCNKKNVKKKKGNVSDRNNCIIKDLLKLKDGQFDGSVDCNIDEMVNKIPLDCNDACIKNELISIDNNVPNVTIEDDADDVEEHFLQYRHEHIYPFFYEHDVLFNRITDFEDDDDTDDDFPAYSDISDDDISSENSNNDSDSSDVSFVDTISEVNNDTYLQSFNTLNLFSGIQSDGAFDLNVDEKLPSVKHFWTIKTKQKKDISSSEGEDDGNERNKKNFNANDVNNINQTHKLTPKEQFQQMRKRERQIESMEQQLSNSDLKPTTSDHFDRLLLASPNNSLLWIKYMCLHLKYNELDKTRAIAQKALKTIQYRLTNELLNIWTAKLNLELRYGTQDTFEQCLRDAFQCNDRYRIYCILLKIYVEIKKIKELNSIIDILQKKFRTNPEMWSLIATAYFDVGFMEKGKQLLNKALKSLPEKEHINMIIKFANLNSKYGDKITAHALFEQVLISYPKRVDCWSQYIDILIKDNEIDLARQILDRSVIQKLPLKKIRTLFKKYLDFEEKYGNETKIEEVKQMAAKYVKKEISC